jgi:rsbT co-antagonist protein RsbR
MDKEKLFGGFLMHDAPQIAVEESATRPDTHEPATSRVTDTVAAGIAEEGEQSIREQQEAIRLLSAPVLQVLEKLLIVTIIGVVDRLRARQLTEQLLRSIRTHRAKVVLIDITGVSAMDPSVATRLGHMVEATRLLGASVIITGLSSEITQTFVAIGANLGKMNTVADLQAGLEKAKRLLGQKANPPSEGAQI